MKNKKIKLRIINICFFLLVLTLTIHIVFKKNDIFIIAKHLKEINLIYLFLGIILMLIYISCEGINIRRVLKTLGHKIPFINSYKYACVGFFFSGITPSASGGDPAQLYFMKKDKLPISHSALSLLVELSSFQFICCLLAITSFIFNYDTLIYKIGNIKYLMFVGITLNIIYLIFLLVMIFSKKVAIKLLDLICKILNFFHYKKTENFSKKALKQIEEYHNCSLYLKSNKSLLIKIVLTTFIEMIIYHSIPYWIYLSFGLNTYNIFDFITMGSILYTTVACLPFPGAMGVSEGSFMIMFKMFFPTKILGSAMILSRGVSYYLFIIITGLIILSFILTSKLKENQEKKI